MADSNGPPLPPAIRAVAACIEPFYAAAMRIRNAMYDKGYLAVHSLGRPAVSVGNITTGGTGKTPVSIWLARRLADAKHHPAILLRGYKPTPDGISDEAQLLRTALAGRASVIIDPDRVRGAATAIKEHPQTSVFVLDDGMQHRRASRNFDLVLINARNPFGFDRIFPRGLLREPLNALKRANGFLITHASEVQARELTQIESTLRGHNTTAGIYHADHRMGGFLDADGREVNPAGKKYFAFCGLGDPDGFFAGLATLLGEPVGTKAFPDHHAYSPNDLAGLQMAGADYLITTEKDWTKLSKSPAPAPVLRAQLAIRFQADHEELLFKSILDSLPTAT